MSKTASLLAKCLAIAAAVGLATCALLYGFFVSHQELGIAPGVAYRWAGLASLLAGTASFVYFRMKAVR